MSVPYVPLPRTLKLGSVGRDVVGFKRAAQKLNAAFIGNTTRFYGTGAVGACKSVQAALGLHVDGEYGPDTHKALSPFFDAYGAWLMGLRMPDKSPRTRLTQAAMALYNYQKQTGRVHYSMKSNRMTIVRDHLKPPYHGVIYEDCSSSVTGYFWQADLMNPNGWPDYDAGRTMYTGTLCKHGFVVANALPGDLIFYGHGEPWSHVAIAVGDVPDEPTKLCVTHGHEGGPFLTNIDYRSDRGQIRSYIAR